MKISIVKTDWRTQLSVAFALMTIIPLLTFGYFLTAYLMPNVNTIENILLVLALNIALSVTGFILLLRPLSSLTRIRLYLEDVARGDLGGKLTMPEGTEGASICVSVESIVRQIAQDRDRMRVLTTELQKEVDRQVAEVKRTNEALAGELYQRKQAEKTAGEAIDRFETTLEGTEMVAVQGFERTGAVTRWNRASELLFQYSKVEALGRRTQDLLMRDSVAGVDFLSCLEEVWTSLKVSKTREWTVKARDGDARSVAWTLFPVVSDGKCVEVLGMVLDITEHRKTEEALRGSNMMLSKALEDLKHIEQRLVQEERMSALGQMASSIAHDFNNALMPILGLTEFMLTNPKSLDDREDLVGTLQDIFVSAKRAREVVVRLREFYKTDLGANLDVMDVNVVLDKALAAIQTKKKGAFRDGAAPVDIRRQYGEVPLINADEAQMVEAFVNILLNAHDAMPEGGVLTLRTHVDGKWVVVLINDTGVGMAADVQKRCFEPFFTTKPGERSGIGLSMVFGIIRRHKGSVEVTSEPGRGTTVCLRLPPMSLDGSPTVVPENVTPTPRKLRILVVDDDMASRSLLTRYLTAAGHSVETANTGDQGIEKFGKERFDLVVTDRAMPDMCGDKVAEAVGRSGGKVPVIMLTGFGDIMKDRGEIPEGVTQILSKPVMWAELNKAITDVVAAH